MEPIIRTDSLRYVFSPEETVTIARQQAQHHNTLRTFQEELDQIKADYKGKITAAELAISACTLRITSGYEMRSVRQLVLKFRPDQKSKLIVRLDNGRGRIERLEQAETQMKFGEAENPFTFQANVIEEDSYHDGNWRIFDDILLTQAEADMVRELCDVSELREPVQSTPPVADPQAKGRLWTALERTAEHINGGALDKNGIKCSATISPVLPGDTSKRRK